MSYYVEIREYMDDGSEGTLVHRYGPMSQSKAEKVERGIDLRIDYSRFYSRTVAAIRQQGEE